MVAGEALVEIEETLVVTERQLVSHLPVCNGQWRSLPVLIQDEITALQYIHGFLMISSASPQ
jgi:hypothetical protein